MDVSVEKLEQWNNEFFELCQQRHEAGAEEYGEFNFLKVDLPQFIVEELADLANYARFLFIRVKVLEDLAREGGINFSDSIAGEVQQSDELPAGTTTFVAKSEVSGFLPKES